MQKRCYTYIILSLFVTGILLQSCQQKESSTPLGQVIPMSSPAGANSSEPNLHVGLNGQLYLSWLTVMKNGSVQLRYSLLEDNRWSASKIVGQGENWFVNWADFPSMCAFDNGSLAAHFLVKNDTDPHAYDINITVSNDNGKSWIQPFKPHKDNTSTEHGFVSMVPHKNQFLAMWLDGSHYALINEKDTAPSNQMILRSAILDKNGRISEEALIDGSVCSCCQTDAALVSSGPILVYRDRSDMEIRDISVVRYINNVWSNPQTISHDGWEIAGCPVNGPAIAAHNSHVAVAWFTSANNVPKVKVAFSLDGGVRFGKALLVSDSKPIGRVDVVVLDDGSAMVSWLEPIDDVTVLKVCRIQSDGIMDVPIVVGKSSEARASGFPKMALKDKTLYFAWTGIGGLPQVHTASIRLY